MSFKEFKETLEKSASTVFLKSLEKGKVPKTFENFKALTAQHFPSSSSSEVSALFAKSVGSSNEHMKNGLNAVRDELVRVVSDLRKLEMVIAFRVPPAEENNNFGVMVQNEIRKFIKDQREKLAKELDTFPSYFKDRAEAWKKVVPSVSSSETVSKSSSSSNETDNKESKEKSSSSDSKSSETKTSAPSKVDDDVDYLIAIDVKWYFYLKNVLEEVMSTYLTVSDLVVKNDQRIKYPKGEHYNEDSFRNMY